jgi:hypothetical protein
MHLNTNNNGQGLVDFAAAKKYGDILNLFFHTKKFINKHGDLQTEKRIIKSTTY